MRLLILTISIAYCSITYGQIYQEQTLSRGIDHIHYDSTMMGGGCVFFDSNKDGYDELYITGGRNRDHLYINNQNGTFSESGIASGFEMTDSIKTVGVISGDIDNDGFKDLFITTSEQHRNLLFHNNGDGTFTEIGLSAGITDTSWATAASFGDVNKDGLIDLYIGNYVDYWDTPFFLHILDGLHNKLYINNGNNTFTDVSVISNAGIKCPTLVTALTDYDFDHDLDILVGNDFGGPFSNNQLLRNNFPINEFTDISLSSGMDKEIQSMGIAIGDYDEDQDLDYYITNMFDNIFHVNNNNQTFDEVAYLNGTQDENVVSWGTFFFDYDNDTYLDLFSSSGQVMPPALAEANTLFINQQDGNFINQANALGIDDTLISRGAIYSDIDLDGDLDIFVANIVEDTTGSPRHSLYINNNNSGNNYFSLDLEGTESNFDALGARVRIVAGGRSFIREIDGGGATFLSQSTHTLHWGLGNISTIDSIIVHWPTGNVQIETGVAVNSHLTIVENDFTSLKENNLSSLKIFPNPSTGQININSSLKIDQIQVFSQDGRLVHSSTKKKSFIKNLNLEDLLDGIYFMDIRFTNGTQTTESISLMR